MRDRRKRQETGHKRRETRDRDRRRETGDGKWETGDGTHKRETADGTGDWRQEKADRIQKTGDDSLTSYPENLIKRMNFTIF